jgi:hypothetical protein
MGNESLKLAIEKLINSKLIKKVYPMLDSIKVTDLNENKDTITLKIIVDDENMDANNMFDKEFDPHYLIDYHMNRILKYLGLKIPNTFFDIYTTSGKFIYGFSKESGKWENYFPNEKGEKSIG